QTPTVQRVNSAYAWALDRDQCVRSSSRVEWRKAAAVKHGDDSVGMRAQEESVGVRLRRDSVAKSGVCIIHCCS
ncbi:hypothetical protein LRD18_09065, partial [Halorhodospira halochloris]|uniref:hypothetical protein n=1 Tax=Halorhodospira halochloris TaxID=1052 RepID=UPI001EE78DE8